MEFSSKGKKLIDLYSKMADSGYERTDGEKVDVAFSDFELRPFREPMRKILKKFKVRSTLDYGCGGSNWYTKQFDPATGNCAAQYFGLENAYHYEPAREIDERQPVDCVVSFDVLEHIFISDVPNVLRDMFSYANKLLLLNVACYPAAAKLPNGENAHITVRPPHWWKGMLDSIAPEFPDVSIYLACSPKWRNLQAFEIYSGTRWQEDKKFVIEY